MTSEIAQIDNTEAALERLRVMPDDQVDTWFIKEGFGVFEDLMLTSEVATLFGVQNKTVVRWANAKKLDYRRTLGGHRRYVRASVQRLVLGELIRGRTFGG